MKNKENDTPMSISVWSSFQSSINYLLKNFYYIMSKYCLQTNDDEHTMWAKKNSYKTIGVTCKPIYNQDSIVCGTSYTLSWQRIDLKTIYMIRNDS